LTQHLPAPPPGQSEASQQFAAQVAPQFKGLALGHWQLPAWQVLPPLQTSPQPEQAPLVPSVVSQPGWPLQSSKPGWHPNVHVPVEQFGLAVCGPPHGALQAPQCASVFSCCSQPKAAPPPVLQSPQPPAQPV
jgi:hypothetical protein